METANVVETQGLTKHYGAYAAVEDLNLRIGEGEIFGFLGPNGAGKTTTLLMLLGLSRPSSGKATVCGLDPARNPKAVKSLVGYLPENTGYYEDLDAVQTLGYLADLNGIEKKETVQRTREVLEVVGLSKDAHKKVGAYSRGMKQRLGIAEVLLKNPDVLFLDEPTLGLDPDGAVRMTELIRALSRERNLTVLLSSHHLDHVQRISHRVGIMIRGKMVAQGPMDVLAREKFGIGEGKYSLEEIYMKYFREAV